MATVKSYTDLEQSKKLAKILPLESADMGWYYSRNPQAARNQMWVGTKAENADIPCWSLAALLDILFYPQLSKDKLGSGKEGWMVSVYPDNCRYDSCWHDNPVDTCYEMIVKLNELKML